MGFGADHYILMRCKDVVQSVDSTAEIILYGSRARGDAEEDSDYDLLILTDLESSLKQEELFLRALFPVELETGAVLTFLLYNRQTWNSPLCSMLPIHQNIDTDGIAL